MGRFKLACYRTTFDFLCGCEKTRRLGGNDCFLSLEDGETTVKVLMQFVKSSCCPDRQERCCYCVKGYDAWRNIPRGFKIHFDSETNEFWYSNTTASQEHASLYVDGGKRENELDEDQKVQIKEGTILMFRPSLALRDNPWIANLEFCVVPAVAAAAPPIPDPISLASNTTVEIISVDTPMSDGRLQSGLKTLQKSIKRDSSNSPVNILSTTLVLTPLSPNVLRNDWEKTEEEPEDPTVFPTPKSQQLGPDPTTLRTSEKERITRGDPPGKAPAFRSPEPIVHAPVKTGTLRDPPIYHHGQKKVKLD